MAIIYSYPTVTPESGDLIVGTDITGKVTKNFTVGSIVSTEIPTYITGTTNTVPLFTGANNIGNSIITQSSSNVGIGTAIPISKLNVVETRTSLSGESLTETVFNTLNLAHTADAPAVRCRATVSELINSSSFSSFANTASRSTAKATGSGDIAALYGASNWSIVEGTGNYTYSIGGLNWSKIDNPSATVANVAGTHTEVQLVQGTVGNIDVFNFDFDQDAGTTITGDFNYIKIKDESPINISGTARALNIESTLPSYFAGNLGIGTATPSSKLDVNGSISMKGTPIITYDDNLGRLSIAHNLGQVEILNSTITADSGGKVGIGTSAPSSKLGVDGGDIEINDSYKGLILRSPDGTRYRVTVANGGTLSVSAV